MPLQLSKIVELTQLQLGSLQADQGTLVQCPQQSVSQHLWHGQGMLRDAKGWQG